MLSKSKSKIKIKIRTKTKSCPITVMHSLLNLTMVMITTRQLVFITMIIATHVIMASSIPDIAILHIFPTLITAGMLFVIPRDDQQGSNIMDSQAFGFLSPQMFLAAPAYRGDEATPPGLHDLLESCVCETETYHV